MNVGGSAVNVTGFERTLEKFRFIFQSNHSWPRYESTLGLDMKALSHRKLVYKNALVKQARSPISI